MPLLRYRVYELGTQLYCAPTVDGREVWGSTMRHVAVEGRCFVLAACQIRTPSHFQEIDADMPVRTLLLPGKGPYHLPTHATSANTCVGPRHIRQGHP